MKKLLTVIAIVTLVASTSYAQLKLNINKHTQELFFTGSTTADRTQNAIVWGQPSSGEEIYLPDSLLSSNGFLLSGQLNLGSGLSLYYLTPNLVEKGFVSGDDITLTGKGETETVSYSHLDEVSQNYLESFIGSSLSSSQDPNHMEIVEAPEVSASAAASPIAILVFLCILISEMKRSKRREG